MVGCGEIEVFALVDEGGVLAYSVGETGNTHNTHTKEKHTMQAITTTYYGPGKVRGSRIKAECDRGAIWFPWDHNLDVEGNHVAAAQALVDKFLAEDAGNWYATPPEDNPWGRRRIAGGMKGGGYCHVFQPKEI